MEECKHKNVCFKVFAAEILDPIMTFGTVQMKKKLLAALKKSSSDKNNECDYFIT